MLDTNKLLNNVDIVGFCLFFKFSVTYFKIYRNNFSNIGNNGQHRLSTYFFLTIPFAKLFKIFDYFYTIIVYKYDFKDHDKTADSF